MSSDQESDISEETIEISEESSEDQSENASTCEDDGSRVDEEESDDGSSENLSSESLSEAETEISNELKSVTDGDGDDTNDTVDEDDDVDNDDDADGGGDDDDDDSDDDSDDDATDDSSTSDTGSTDSGSDETDSASVTSIATSRSGISDASSNKQNVKTKSIPLQQSHNNGTSHSPRNNTLEVRKNTRPGIAKLGGKAPSRRVSQNNLSRSPSQISRTSSQASGTTSRSSVRSGSVSSTSMRLRTSSISQDISRKNSVIPAPPKEGKPNVRKFQTRKPVIKINKPDEIVKNASNTDSKPQVQSKNGRPKKTGGRLEPGQDVNKGKISSQGIEMLMASSPRCQHLPALDLHNIQPDHLGLHLLVTSFHIDVYYFVSFHSIH